jgi:tRNA (guanosine-2'-O-)-methyltransferase
VTLYEAYRQKDLAGQYEEPGVPPDQFQSLLSEWGFRNEEIEE